MTELNGWQIVVIICTLIGAALAGLRMYFPPRHVVEAEEKRPRVIGCEAGSHIGRLHDRTDRLQDAMAKVSESLVKLTAIQESMATNEARREIESKEFHKQTFSNFEKTHSNQIDIRDTINAKVDKLAESLRIA